MDLPFDCAVCKKRPQPGLKHQSPYAAAASLANTCASVAGPSCPPILTYHLTSSKAGEANGRRLASPRQKWLDTYPLRPVVCFIGLSNTQLTRAMKKGEPPTPSIPGTKSRPASNNTRHHRRHKHTHTSCPPTSPARIYLGCGGVVCRREGGCNQPTCWPGW